MVETLELEPESPKFIEFDKYIQGLQNVKGSKAGGIYKATLAAIENYEENEDVE